MWEEQREKQTGVVNQSNCKYLPEVACIPRTGTPKKTKPLRFHDLHAIARAHTAGGVRTTAMISLQKVWSPSCPHRSLLLVEPGSTGALLHCLAGCQESRLFYHHSSLWRISEARKISSSPSFLLPSHLHQGLPLAEEAIWQRNFRNGVCTLPAPQQYTEHGRGGMSQEPTYR